MSTISLKQLAREWLPPRLIRLVRQPNKGSETGYEGLFDTWEDANLHCTGYDAQHILNKVLAATLQVKRGEAAFERDSVLFDKIEYPWFLLSGLMWAAARNGGRLNVLDFGGALGSSFFQSRAMLVALPEVRWNIVEQAHYVQAGREYIQDETLRFYASVDECLLENEPNVILLSSVLQYLPSPDNIIAQLAKADAPVLIIDRTPFSVSEKNEILIQHVPAYIYDASYPLWVFSEGEFLRKLNSKWNLVAQTLSPEGRVRLGTGFEFSYQGMLLESKK